MYTNSKYAPMVYINGNNNNKQKFNTIQLAARTGNKTMHFAFKRCKGQVCDEVT